MSEHSAEKDACGRCGFHGGRHGSWCSAARVTPPAARGFGLLREASSEDDLTPITGGLDGDTECVLPPAGCDHRYPPANRDGTCPSCGKPRVTPPVEGRS